VTHSIATLTGFFKGGKVEDRNGKKYYKGFLVLEPTKPGIIIEVFGKRMDDFALLKRKPITVVGELRLEAGASTQKIDKDIVINAIAFFPVDIEYFNSISGDQYFVENHCNVSITGISGRDPDIKYFESGKCKVAISLAVSRGKNTQTSWLEVELWDRPAEVVGDYVKKGYSVSIPQSIPKIEEWEPKDGGEMRRKWKFIGKKVDLHSWKENEEREKMNSSNSFKALKSLPTNSEIVEKIPLDELPF